MVAALIDVSAQFGGRDAADAVLPHFRALKAAALGRTVAGFPRPKLAFILRVDGEVSTFGLSGPGNIDVDAGGMYVSVDLGITFHDRLRLRGDGRPAFLVQSIVDSFDALGADPRLIGTDFPALGIALQGFSVAYEKQIAGDPGGPHV